LTFAGAADVEAPGVVDRRFNREFRIADASMSR
jgi:hypothetical protein